MKILNRHVVLCAALCAATLFIAGCARSNENNGAAKTSETAKSVENHSSVRGTGGAVVVASLTAERGQQGVVIPVKMTNDIDVRGVVLPLQIHHIDTGAFITGLKLSYGDRLPAEGTLSDVQFTNQYLTADGNCMEGQQGGYATIASQDTLMHDIAVSPVGVLFSRQRIVADDLPAGADATGSFVITVNLTNTPGRFEIDTTCTDPSNHLMFVKPDNIGTIPVFTKGTITIK